LAAEGEICWAGMHSWRRNVELLERVKPAEDLGIPGDMAHTMLFYHGIQRSGRRAASGELRLSQSDKLAAAYRKMARRALRPWTIDFHVARTTHGEGLRGAQ